MNLVKNISYMYHCIRFPLPVLFDVMETASALSKENKGDGSDQNVQFDLNSCWPAHVI